MLPNRTKFQSSSSRITKHEANYRKLNKDILSLISLNKAPRNAEEIWLELKTNGVIISMATFHTRLKKMVDAGEVTKLKLGYNKYEYLISPTTENNLGI